MYATGAGVPHRKAGGMQRVSSAERVPGCMDSPKRDVDAGRRVQEHASAAAARLLGHANVFIHRRSGGR